MAHNYNPVVSTTPPTSGNSKMLYSPELFNEDNGDYPISPLPASMTYPTDGGHLQYFEGFEGAAPGFLQCTLSGAAPGTDGWWEGEFTVMDMDRNYVIGGQYFKLSQAYIFRPENTSPYYYLSTIYYTDATFSGSYSLPEGGGDQKTELQPGDYIVRFVHYNTYTQTVPAESPTEHPPGGDGAQFSVETTETISVMEHTVTIVANETTVQAFSLT